MRLAPFATLSRQILTVSTTAMIIVHVFVHVKADAADAFISATLENARNSVNEPGVIRFDMICQEDDATQFMLIEIYRSSEDAGRHKETAHYATWRDLVAPMMDGARRSTKYRALFPAIDQWEYPIA